jgi:gliding motility-associated protein GldE
LETITDLFTVLNSFISVNQIDVIIIIEFIFFILLLFCSALISASEVAFFSLTPTMLEAMNNSENKKDKKSLELLKEPDKLLATILIANNTVNITIVILSTYITAKLLNFENIWIKFIFEAIIVTFLILIFGEITPKIYANKYKKNILFLAVYIIDFLQKLFKPLIYVLLKSSKIVERKSYKHNQLSMSDLSYAIDIASESTHSEKKILKNVIKFGNIEVRQIMTPRVDVISVEYFEKLSSLKNTIKQCGFSRIPIYKSNLDQIEGILYIKDLVPYINKDNYFDWQQLIRPAYFVPENKKIDDLLQEFRTKKIHLAVVSDEYGGFSGIITLEDILEEIVGEINDEFDINNQEFITKISDNEFVIEGKLLLKDFFRIFNLDENYFEDVQGDAETIAGLVLEIIGDFPTNNQKINYKNLEFKIESLNKRRIVKIKVTRKEK